MPSWLTRSTGYLCTSAESVCSVHECWCLNSLSERPPKASALASSALKVGTLRLASASGFLRPVRVVAMSVHVSLYVATAALMAGTSMWLRKDITISEVISTAPKGLRSFRTFHGWKPYFLAMSLTISLAACSAAGSLTSVTLPAAPARSSRACCIASVVVVST